MDSKIKFKDCPLCKKYGPSTFCKICKGTLKLPIADVAEKKKKRNLKSISSATRRYRPYTKYEKSLLLNSDLSTSALAKRLRRSIKSVESMKNRLRKLETKHE